MPRLTLGVRIVGGLAANFRPSVAAVQRETRAAVRETGTEHHGELVETAPRDTGFLASRARLDFSDDELTYAAGYAEADFTAAGKPFYVRYLHEGTRYIAPRTWMRDAEANARARFTPRLRAGLSRVGRAA